MDSQKLVKACSDAVDIWEGGACNPSGIARSLVNAVDAAREVAGTVGKEVQYAPARIILAQINYLLGIGIGDYGGGERDAEMFKRDQKWINDVLAAHGIDKGFGKGVK